MGYSLKGYINRSIFLFDRGMTERSRRVEYNSMRSEGTAQAGGQAFHSRSYGSGSVT